MLHLRAGDQRIESLELEFFYLQLQLCYRIVVVVTIVDIISVVIALLLLSLFRKNVITVDCGITGLLVIG
jgi:hypothetical protein